MLFNSTKLMLANTMMIGVIMTICSNNWVSMWMGLEISLLSFIPFMQNEKKTSAESLIKYFIMQSMASTLFLFSVIIMLIGVSINNEIMMMIAMLIKIGSAPFHNWVLMIIESLSYFPMFFMLTVLKIPPLMIIYQSNSKMLSIPIMLSMIMSSMFCLNQTSIRKIMGYSSVFNVGVMLSMSNTFSTMMMYLILYSIPMILLIMVLKTLKINFINQMAFNEFNPMIKFNIWINILSMGGFPPLIGFLSKMMAIQNLLNLNQILMVTTLMLTSLLVMVFYMRMTFTMMTSHSTSNKWTTNKTIIKQNMIYINFILTPLIMTVSMIY